MSVQLVTLVGAVEFVIIQQPPRFVLCNMEKMLACV